MSGSALEKYSIRETLEKVTVNCMEDVHDAALMIKQLGDECGFKIGLCDDVASREPLIDAEGNVLSEVIFGWTAEGERWWQQRNIALECPLVQACRYESEPIWCNKYGFYGNSVNPYIEEIKLDNFFAERAGSKAIIVIPIHLPFAQVSVNSLQPFDQQKENISEEYQFYADFFALLFRRFITGYIATTRKVRRIPSNLLLLKREVECLKWAAIGKTDKEIADIINLSHATVRYHLHRAGDKLYSVNRAQTIFKAGQLGFLGASD